MPNVTCPSCGERGKIPPTLIGADQVQEVWDRFQRRPSDGEGGRTRGRH